MVVTDHSAYDWQWIGAHTRLIVDTRNALGSVAANPARVCKA